MATKRKFKDTVVGQALLGLTGIVAPGLKAVLTGATSVGDALAAIGDSKESPDVKVMLQEFTLKAFEAEVQDRASARQREAVVAAAGGNDVLFKVVGFGITAAFLLMVGGALGLYGLPEDINQRAFDMAFGAVTAQMVAIVSYYFGSSMGSKQKTHLMSK